MFQELRGEYNEKHRFLNSSRGMYSIHTACKANHIDKHFLPMTDGFFIYKNSALKIIFFTPV